MSQIKLKHSGGNGVIIAAPSSNPAADRTLLLPGDGDSTIDTLGRAGNFLQVVQESTTTQVTNTTTTYSDTNLSATRYYFVQSVATNTFTIAESRSATVPIKFSSTGTITNYKVVALADVVRGAPIPVGGSLKVISGQKLVLESTDRIWAYCSSARNVDVVCSMLEDVS